MGGSPIGRWELTLAIDDRLDGRPIPRAEWNEVSRPSARR